MRRFQDPARCCGRPCSLRTCLANSTMASCMPRQRPRIRDIVFPGHTGWPLIFPSMPRLPKPPGTRMPSTSPQNLGHIFPGHRLGIHPFDVDTWTSAGHAAVLQCLHHGQIVSVMQLHIFSHQGNGHFACGMLQGVRPYCFQSVEIRLRAVQLQALAGNLGQVLPPPCASGASYRYFHVQVLQHVSAGHIAEQGDLVLDALIHGHALNGRR